MHVQKHMYAHALFIHTRTHTHKHTHAHTFTHTHMQIGKCVDVSAAESLPVPKAYAVAGCDS